MYLDKVNLRDWQTKKQILIQLADKGIEADEDLRQFRKEVQTNNRMWSIGMSAYYVVHDTTMGYKWAVAVDEIEKSIRDNEKRAFSQLKAVRQTRLALGLIKQGEYNKIAEVRKAKGITGMELVRRMKEVEPTFDSPTLSRIENGKVLPMPETLRHIADILGVETWEIISPQYLM